MIRFRIIALALVALTITAGIVWLAIPEPAPRAERLAPAIAGGTNPAGDRRLADVEQQLAQLQWQLDAEREQFQRELAQQRDELARLTRAVAGGQGYEPAVAHSRPEPEPSAEELERADHEREQRRLAQLDAVFEREPADRAWSPGAAQQIASAVEQIAYDSAERGAALVDAQCRASLCRLELAASDAHAVDGFSQALPRQLGWQGSMKQTLVREPDGSLTSIIYVSRDGRDLPAEVEAP